MNKYYEEYIKLDNGKWLFLKVNINVFDNKEQEKFCIKTKEKYGFIYKTYKYLNGRIEEKKYKFLGVAE